MDSPNHDINNISRRESKTDPIVILVLLITFCLFAISESILIHNTWKMRVKESILLNPDYEAMGMETSLVSWQDNENSPVRLQKSHNPDQENDMIFSVEKESSQGWSGIGKPFTLNSPTLITDTLIINIKNLYPSLLFLITVTEKQSPTNPFPEAWDKEYSLNDNEWHKIELPLSSLQIKKYYQPESEPGNQKLDTSQIDQIAFDFPPKQSLNFLLGDIVLETTNYSWTSTISLILNLLWLIHLIQYVLRYNITRSDKQFIIELAKFMTYQAVLILTPGNFEIGIALNILLGLSLVESIYLLNRNRICFLCCFVILGSPLLANLIMLNYAANWLMIPILLAAHSYHITNHSKIRGFRWSIISLLIIVHFNYLGLGMDLPLITLSVGLASLFIIYFIIREQTKYLYREKEKLNLQVLLEQQMLHSQKMEAISQFSRGMAHEFNNLLAGIIGNLNLIQLKKHQDISDFAENAVQSATRAAELIRQLNFFSQLTKSEMQSIKLNNIVEDTVRLFQKNINNKITLNTNIPKDIPLINADPHRLKIVFMNLLMNAIDAIEQAKAESIERNFIINLEITLKDIELKNKSIKVKPGKYVVLRISDNGIGIDDEAQKHIFDPFYSTKEVGMGVGLGLTSAYGIIKEYKGWIDVESELHQGTTFHIYLPLE
jgi:signal transduction histidine kinase